LPEDPTVVLDEQFDTESGQILDIPVQFGTNSNITRYFKFNRDYILDFDKIYNGQEYYLGVTAYSVARQAGFLPAALESEPLILLVQPQIPFGVVYETALGDTITTTQHATGGSDGGVYPIVIDPKAITGHEYKVTFTDANGDGATEWDLTDVTAGNKVLLQGVPNQSGDDKYLFTDGFQLRVVGAPLSFKDFLVVANANGPLDPPEYGAFAFNSSGFPHPYRDSPTDPAVGAGLWGIHTAEVGNAENFTYDYFLTRTSQGGTLWNQIIPYDYELRFTAAGSVGIYPLEFSGGAAHVLMQLPFELWRVGDSRKNDPSDDVRMIPYILDENENGVFDLVGDHTISGGTNDPYTDWIYWQLPNNAAPGDAGYQAFANSVTTNLAGYGYHSDCVDVMRRMVLANWNGGTLPSVNQALPETGTVFRIISTKPNTIVDVFTFTTPAPTTSAAQEQASADNIGVYPNPYYAFNPAETNRLFRFVTFNNLPRKASVRIFNLAGQLVRRIEKDDDSQFLQWDLVNHDNIPVASGMYIAYIDATLPSGGSAKKILKMAIIQEQEVLDIY
jgi:hypothetical protein